MYIKDKLSVIEQVFLRKKIYIATWFFFFVVFFLLLSAKLTFLAKMRNVEKIVFSNITYKEGRFYQKRPELDLRCESSRKGEHRHPNWRYL